MNPFAVTPGSPSRHSASARWRRTLALFAGVAVTISALRGEEIWRIDNLKEIGGHTVAVVGAPQVGDTPDGKALVFDGAHDGIFVASIPIADAKAFTIEVLFSPATDGPEAQRFIHFQDTEGRRGTFEIRNNGKGGWWLDTFLRTDLSAGDKGVTLIDPTRVHPTGKWYWVALRYDGKTMADFVNGRKELEREHAFEPFGEGKISLGVRQNLVYWFKGAIREVRFHREALLDDKLQRVE